MSNRYKGAVISATPPTTTGGNDGVASGAWTLEQQMQAQAAGLWPNQPIFYIEDVFSTYLYTGNNSTQTITNGIDLSTKGGMVWSKSRSSALSNFLCDTVRGRAFYLYANATVAQQGPSTGGNDITSFNTNGYSLGPISNADINNNAATFVSWTFREQPKFFDVVTYSGTGAVRTVAHNLGSVPGCILIKNLSDSDGWLVYHRSIGATKTLSLNTTGAAVTDGNTYFNDTEPTSSVFTVNIGGKGNASGNNYVAYLFAHDAGGFGLTGTDNVISCGSYTTDASGNATVNLGYEPQFVIHKNTTSAQNWRLLDVMRGMTDTQAMAVYPNLSDAESNDSVKIVPTATGFNSVGAYSASQTIIYIAIRRGPMRVPTVGTNVFKVETYNQTSASDPAFNLGKVADMGLRRLSDFVSSWTTQTRLTNNQGLTTNTSDAESTQNFGFWDNNVGWYQGGAITPPYSQANWYGWTFARAPGFFDVVCYTGNSTNNRQLPHNLGVIPELVFHKSRSNGTIWYVWVNGVSPSNYSLILNLAFPWTAYNTGLQSSTSTNLNLSTSSGEINITGQTYIAYLFATCPGVSKVGTYTGTGALLTVNCGFAAGARFVLIKRTDDTGDWYVYDSVRGITSGNDPYMVMNSTAVQVDGTNYVDTTAVGFQVTAAAPAGLNASGGSYIFLAIA
jgi:hypothetical protein